MSFIAAVLILNLDTADAFIAFSNLLNKPCQMAFFRVDHGLVSMQENCNQHVVGMCRERFFFKKKRAQTFGKLVRSYFKATRLINKKNPNTHTPPLKKTQTKLKPTPLTFLNRQVNEIVRLLFCGAQRIVMRMLL